MRRFFLMQKESTRAEHTSLREHKCGIIGPILRDILVQPQACRAYGVDGVRVPVRIERGVIEQVNASSRVTFEPAI